MNASSPSRLRRSGFAISELILTISTATVVVGTALTSLTIYMGTTAQERTFASAQGSAAILPAEEISMEATLFHLELQRLTHEADLCYVIGGSRCVPASENTADFTFTPPLLTSDLRILDVLHSVSHAPGRAQSSHVLTELLKVDLPSAFAELSETNAPYQQRHFTILTATEDLTATSIIHHTVIPEGDWVVFDSAIYLPSDNAWSRTLGYRCAAPKELFDTHSDMISVGAVHYWARHDRTNPVASEDANSLWNRYEESFCRIEFPDPCWNLEVQPAGTPLLSRHVYLLPVAK